MREVFAPYKGAIFLGGLILLVTNGFVLLLPRLINEAIQIIEGDPSASSILRWVGVPAPGVAAIITAIIVAAIGGGLFRVASRVVLFNVGRDVERALRSDLFSHLSTQSPTFYGQNTTGDLMSRLTNDLNNVRLMSGFALLNVMNASFIFLGTMPFLFAIDVELALYTLIPFPLVMGVAQILAKTMYRRVRANQEALGDLTAHLQENLAGQQVVRAFSQEEGEERRFAEVNDRAFQASMRLAAIRSVFFPLMGLMSAIGIAIALFAGGYAILEGRVEIGDVVEVNARLLQLTWPAIAMGFIFSVYQRGKAGLDRINELFEARPDIADGPIDERVTGRVEARGLTVTYPRTEAPALKDLSFSVEAGHVLGIVGKNASGKSTLVRAAARMLPVGEGQLFIDGKDVRDWALAALRRQVAVVTDDGFLFSATLRENLTFARPDASDEEVEEVLQVADLARDVEAFPEGLATLVGERGVTLSGGQKQRVALGRALLSRPRVLILDDSLSAVDAETEANIVGALRAGRFGAHGAPPTLIVISHRLSAVREAEQILVLEAGECIEQGTHEELLAGAGRYADLWGREQLMKAFQEGDEPVPDEDVTLDSHTVRSSTAVSSEGREGER